MGYVKIVKNKPYFKRFQVKFRRRREAKTDYYQRQNLIIQDKNKYKAPKYRFVVRCTNRDIICQIFAADMKFDQCLASAYSHELRRYGIKNGFTNYAAAYATGLLLARRVNAKFKLSVVGSTKGTGKDYLVPLPSTGRSPFRAVLDVGLARTTTGARIFGALKGAVDGGLYIPHNNRRFPGSTKDEESGEWSYEPEVHHKYIFAGHVKEYMEKLKEENEDRFKTQFKKYIEAGITAETIEQCYREAHKQIRADPNRKRDPLEKGAFLTRDKPVDANKPFNKKRWHRKKLTIRQRKGNIKKKLKRMGKDSIGPLTFAKTPNTAH